MGRQFARVALLISFAGALLGVVPPALACSCGSETPYSAESMRHAIELHDGGIVGTVTGTGQDVVTMRVERVIKGGFGPVVNIDPTDIYSELCGSWKPAVGSRLGIFVEGSPTEGWSAGSCFVEVDAGDMLAYAPSTRPPDPSIEPIGPVASGPGSIVPWTIVAITVLLIAGSWFLLTQRRRRVST